MPEIPLSGTKTWSVNRPLGASPAIKRTRMTTVTSRMSAMVAPSTASNVLVPRRAGATASSQLPISATAVSTNGPHDGGCGQIPTCVRNAVPSTPAAELVTTA
ncbi:hypothetical protein SAMN05421854_112101 [Amycolatopsis rubida]|uniref:Uncharacterized protein n=1 Tax=Amycolatopsis rubida TaxID=112413 RepID=A0A1I5YHR2_9PSEU|nr:hypothetical protein SAMN05421854_112101 [Amycolatopsis rubida]